MRCIKLAEKRKRVLDNEKEICYNNVELRKNFMGVQPENCREISRIARREKLCIIY